jgi:uncharacterized RDD family membrane protein YckC
MASVVDKRYQTFWPRFGAGWIDSLLWIPPIFLDYWFGENVHSPMLLASWLIAYTFSYNIYSVAMHTRFGQTLGKMVTGVKVLDISENKLSLRQALLRDCVPIGLSFLIIFKQLPGVIAGGVSSANVELGYWDNLEMYGTMLWFAAELVTMLANSKRRALHDLIAGSVVVRTRLAGTTVESDATAGYTSPATIGVGKSARSSAEERGSGLLIGYTVVTGALAAIAVGASLIIPSFGDLFASFGADLPRITFFLFMSAPYWGVVPLFSAAVALDVWRHKECSFRYKSVVTNLLVGLVILAVAIVPFTFWALYLPIYKIGVAVP